MREQFACKRLPKTREGVATAIAATRAGKKPVVIADHSDRTGNSTHILEELIRQGAGRFCITTLGDGKSIDEIKARAKPGDPVSVSVGGYADEYARKPIKIDGKAEFLGRYNRFESAAVILFGDNNRIILTPLLDQVTDTDIFGQLGISLDSLDIIVLKSRVHFRRGYVENGFAKNVVWIDAPGLGPADLTGIPYNNIPGGLYPLSVKR